MTNTNTLPKANLEELQNNLSQLKGFGPETTKKLISYFGENLNHTLENEPEKITKIRGFGPHKVQKIKKAWEKHKNIVALVELIHHPSIKVSHAQKIFEHFGPLTKQKITENPYLIIQALPQLSFSLIDHIAQNLGETYSPIHQWEAASFEILYKANAQMGHCALPLDEYLTKLKKIYEIQDDDALSHLKKTNIFSLANNMIALKDIFQKEQDIAHKISILQKHKLHEQCVFLKKTLTAARKANKDIQLTAEQIEAVHSAFDNKVSILTGGPGVGKTTLINFLCQQLNKEEIPFSLCAPTGRAARRLQEVTGFEAKTLHRLLEINPQTQQFRFNRNTHISSDFFIVDEFSMVDLHLCHSFFEALPARAHIVLIGDHNQLPSIGPGKILYDLIVSKAIPTTKLERVFRQDNNSHIVDNAHRLLNKKNFLENENNKLSDFYFLQTRQTQDIENKIRSLIQSRIPKTYHLNPLHDIQILSPLHDGPLGIKRLNQVFQKILNPQKSTTADSFYGFFSGDKVIQTQNDYDKDVFNGDIGFIKQVNSQKKLAWVDFYGRTLLYTPKDIKNLQHAYVLSIHKAQGSEYPAVIIPIVKENLFFWTLPLLYTAVTRAKKLVILIGHKNIISQIIQKPVTHQQRYTLLPTLLKLT